MESNSIEQGRRQLILLSTVGVETCKIFKVLEAPVKPKEKSYSKLVKLMKNHHNRKPSVIAERFRFNKRDRK